MSIVASTHAAGIRRATRKRFLGGTMAVLTVALFSSLGYLARGPVGVTTEADKGTGGGGKVVSPGSFTIRGNATSPISPGLMVPLDLELTNPLDVPMSVADLTVTVLKVNAADVDAARPCTEGDFTVDQVLSGLTLTLAPRATSSLSGLGHTRATWPAVGMLDRSVNQDGCKGASLTLGYAASGTLSQ